MEFTLADFIPFVPDLNSKTFESKINNKMEFKLLSQEQPRLNPKLFNHQEIILQYLRNYDNILVYQAFFQV